jgi:RES domain-containing protein
LRLSLDALPESWSGFPAPPELAILGTWWASSLEAAVLQMPSVVVPPESNLILNPRHPDSSRIAAQAPILFAFDTRAWKKPSG